MFVNHVLQVFLSEIGDHLHFTSSPWHSDIIQISQYQSNLHTLDAEHDEE